MEQKAVKKFTTFYGKQIFFATFTKARLHLGFRRN